MEGISLKFPHLRKVLSKEKNCLQLPVRNLINQGKLITKEESKVITTPTQREFSSILSAITDRLHLHIRQPLFPEYVFPLPSYSLLPPPCKPQGALYQTTVHFLDLFTSPKDDLLFLQNCLHPSLSPLPCEEGIQALL